MCVGKENFNSQIKAQKASRPVCVGLWVLGMNASI